MSDRDKINQLKILNDEIKNAVSLVKKGLLSEAIDTSLSALHLFDRVAQAYGNDYPGLIKANKTPKIEPRKKALERQLSKESVRTEDVLDFLADLHNLVSNLDRDIKCLNRKSKAAENYSWLIPVAVFLIFGAWSLRLPAFKKNGLSGYYYTQPYLEGPQIKRMDKNINFDWMKKAPFPKFQEDHFSVSWSGYLYVPKEGPVKFSVVADGYYRLWLGRDLLIDQEGDAPKKSKKAKLKKGYYPFRFDYLDNEGPPGVKLKWKLPGDLKEQIIPSRFFVPSRDRLPEYSVINDRG